MRTRSSSSEQRLIPRADSFVIIPDLVNFRKVEQLDYMMLTPKADIFMA